MHRAILNSHEDVLELFIKHKELLSQNNNTSFYDKPITTTTKIIPNFNLRDSEGQSVLSCCLWNNLLKVAKNLIGKFW